MDIFAIVVYPSRQIHFHYYIFILKFYLFLLCFVYFQCVSTCLILYFILIISLKPVSSLSLRSWGLFWRPDWHQTYRDTPKVACLQCPGFKGILHHFWPVCFLMRGKDINHYVRRNWEQ